MNRETQIAAALIVVVPLCLWSVTAQQAHIYTLFLAVLFGASLYLPNPWLRAGGILVTLWMVAGTFMAWVGMIDVNVFLLFVDGATLILFGMLVYLFFYYAPIERDTALNLICITAILQSCLAVAQWMDLDPVSRGMSYFVEVHGTLPFSTPVGTMANNNFLAAYIAISLPLFLRRNWAYALPLLFFVLCITRTSTAMAAAMVALGWYALGWKGLTVGVAGGVAAYFATGHGLENARFADWSEAVANTTHQVRTILFGWGPGIVWKGDSHLHSEYVGAFYNFGLTGLAVMLGYLKDILKGDRMLSAAMLAAAVNMAGNHPLHTVPTATLILAVAALWERDRHGNA